MVEYVIIAEAAVMAAVYSVVAYSKNYSTDRESFDVYKFAATVLVGIGVGIAMVLAGDVMTQASFETRLAAYAGVVVLVENLVKAAAREYEGRSTSLP